MKRILLELRPDAKLPDREGSILISSLILRKNTKGIVVDIVTDDTEALVSEFRKQYGEIPFRIINEVEPLEHPSRRDVIEVLRKSIEMFAEERYWESHVLLESVWRNSKGTMKSFLQAVILLSASQVHYQMGDLEVAHRQYYRAAEMLGVNSETENFISAIPAEFVYPLRIISRL